MVTTTQRRRALDDDDVFDSDLYDPNTFPDRSCATARGFAPPCSSLTAGPTGCRRPGRRCSTMRATRTATTTTNPTSLSATALIRWRLLGPISTPPTARCPAGRPKRRRPRPMSRTATTIR